MIKQAVIAALLLTAAGCGGGASPQTFADPPAGYVPAADFEQLGERYDALLEKYQKRPELEELKAVKKELDAALSQVRAGQIILEQEIQSERERDAQGLGYSLAAVVEFCGDNWRPTLAQEIDSRAGTMRLALQSKLFTSLQIIASGDPRNVDELSLLVMDGSATAVGEAAAGGCIILGKAGPWTNDEIVAWFTTNAGSMLKDGAEPLYRDGYRLGGGVVDSYLLLHLSKQEPVEDKRT